MAFDPEAIDLAQITVELARLFANNPPRGYLLGKTAVRDEIVRLLDCSQLEAEELVDTMVYTGFLRYEGAPTDEVDTLRNWQIVVPTDL
jgi:hypothetical protein